MAAHSLDNLVRPALKLAALQTSRGLSDRELLERFARGHDEAAFTVLVERYGPIVLGVCRRALADRHDAEDACQATFLVLARKAASVRKGPSVGSWLHGVACRVATNLRRDRDRRQRLQRQPVFPTPVDPAAEVSWREVLAALDEELARLPERYRAPLILCYLDGRTRDEAARLLRLTAGVLHGRLERGRALLRDRLARRGLALSAALLGSALAEGAARAALSPTVVLSSVRAATVLAGGAPHPAGVVSGHVLSLTQEALRGMYLTKLKLGTAAVLGAAVLAAVIAGSLASVVTAQDRPSSSPSTPDSRGRPPASKADTDEDFIRRLSLDLRGVAPTPAEVYFFVSSKEAKKRDKLIDLYIQERQARKALTGPPGTGTPGGEGSDLPERPLQRPLNSPPEAVEGMIKKVDDASDIVTINIGSDAGLQRGDTLEVYRLNPPKYLGRLTVLEVRPGEAIARPGARVLAPLQVGDNVTSKILR